jgi:hypothetical protein
MSLLKNKKAVEGLPLKYIIIALVAALVVGIALQFTGVLKGGIMSTAEKLNQSVTEEVTCNTDNENPVIAVDSVTCTSGNITVNITATDDCGISSVAFADSDDTSDWYPMILGSGTKTNGEWSVFEDLSGTSCPTKIDISAFDESANNNQGKVNDYEI